jgi:hypothetical protein
VTGTAKPGHGCEVIEQRVAGSCSQNPGRSATSWPAHADGAGLAMLEDVVRHRLERCAFRGKPEILWTRIG